MRFAVAIIFGGCVGLSGTLLHNSYPPFGILVSLLAIWIGSSVIRSMFNSRQCDFLFILGWMMLVLRASSLGNGGEILIEANTNGNLFAFGGTALLAISFLRSRVAK
ncbi:MAG: hypothetical protein EB043_01015 [Actinobacteria bacterium]|jgi:uncharacterized membrane protein YeaQ/YmgE (transglycosylase-associated protein family)|nr:hypothetical protein [Actinomycetota bacterium]NCW34748.1 hypothetical protein [Actinomycetota bacterium]NCZ73533.1 hypothetical protein [Actinomycetota bacterium]NDB31013.1 hypothetical protein [Actinomycetota bacterium]NDC52093.1 hypothetical protein [Actinomycetota bacterium]